MTPYDRQIRNILRTIAVLLCIVIVCLVWDIGRNVGPKEAKVIFDIDPGEMDAISRDSTHPDPGLLWKDRNNIPHVRYNFTK